MIITYMPMFEEFRQMLRIYEFRKFTEADITSAAVTLNIDISMYDMAELLLGMNIETEHGSRINNRINVTGDAPEPTLKIVLAHMIENDRYYSDYLIPAEKRMELNQPLREEALTDIKALDFDQFVQHAQDVQPIQPVQVKYEKTFTPNKHTDMRYGAGVLLINNKTGKILLGLRSDKSDNKDTWSSFGGRLNADEQETDSQKAALRELEEETGWSNEKAPLIGELMPAFVYKTPGGDFKFFNYIGLIESEFDIVPNDEEFKEYKWFDKNELEDKSRKDFHFGLKLMFENDGNTIKRYIR